MGTASKIAVTVTENAGILNVVAALFEFAKITARLSADQFLNRCPAGAAPAFMLTAA